MGGTSWSDDAYDARKDFRDKTGKSAFAHDDSVRSSGAAPKCHPKMDPKGVTRESRDSAAHPESLAIGTCFDVTGSMGGVPVIFQKKLKDLMGLLLRKGYVEHPQILTCAIGDATCDSVPLQAGQFESGIEIEDDLSRVYIEQGGGGHITESYELALYFVARHTSIDCFEKRGKKGYLVLTGDEIPYSHVKRDEVKEIFGDNLQEDIPVKDIIAEVKERYNLIFIIPSATSWGKDPKIFNHWASLIGKENVLVLQDPELICETIALAIGIGEDKTDIDGGIDDIKALGVSDSGASAISTAVMPYAKSRSSVAKADVGSLPKIPTDKTSKDKTRRL